MDVVNDCESCKENVNLGSKCSKNSKTFVPPRISEKPNKTRFMFNEKLVFVGNEEFSFEEIRGKKWMEQAKKRNEEQVRVKKLEQEIAQLRAQVALLLKQQSQTTEQSKSTNSETSPEIQQSSKLKEKKDEIKKHVQVAPKEAVDMTSTDAFTKSCASDSSNVFSIVRGMWNGSIAHSDPGFDQSTLIAEKNEERKETKFSIFSDSMVNVPKEKNLGTREKKIEKSESKVLHENKQGKSLTTQENEEKKTNFNIYTDFLVDSPKEKDIEAGSSENKIKIKLNESRIFLENISPKSFRIDEPFTIILPKDAEEFNVNLKVGASTPASDKAMNRIKHDDYNYASASPNCVVGKLSPIAEDKTKESIYNKQK